MWGPRRCNTGHEEATEGPPVRQGPAWSQIWGLNLAVCLELLHPKPSAEIMSGGPSHHLGTNVTETRRLHADGEGSKLSKGWLSPSWPVTHGDMNHHACSHSQSSVCLPESRSQVRGTSKWRQGTPPWRVRGKKVRRRRFHLQKDLALLLFFF